MKPYSPRSALSYGALGHSTTSWFAKSDLVIASKTWGLSEIKVRRCTDDRKLGRCTCEATRSLLAVFTSEGRRPDPDKIHRTYVFRVMAVSSFHAHAIGNEAIRETN